MRWIKKAKWGHVNSYGRMIGDLIKAINYFEHENRFSLDIGDHGKLTIKDGNKAIGRGLLTIHNLPRLSVEDLVDYFSTMEIEGTPRQSGQAVILEFNDFRLLFHFFRGWIEVASKQGRLNAVFVMEIGMLFYNLPDKTEQMEFYSGSLD